MEVLLSTLSLQLPQGATLRLDAARGVTVRVRHGRLWLTEQGLPDDVFLAPGEAWQLRGNGRVVAEADATSRFELVGPRAQWRFAPHRAGAQLAAAPARALGERLRAVLARWRAAPRWMPVPPPSALLR